MKKKPKKKVSGDKQSTLADLLRKHGAQIYDDLDKGNFPKFSIPSRSVSNIVYDKKYDNTYLEQTQRLEVLEIHLSFVRLHN